VYSDVVDNAYIAHPHYARFFKCNYWFHSFDSKFWDCINKFPVTIHNASNLCVLGYIMSSFSVFNARYLRTLHYDKLRDFVFKGKQSLSAVRRRIVTAYRPSTRAAHRLATMALALFCLHFSSFSSGLCAYLAYFS
jgi:hypothetical protein